MLLLPLLLLLLLLGLLVLLLGRFLADLVEEVFLAIAHQLVQSIVLLVERRVVGWVVVDVVVVGNVVEDAGLVRVDGVLIVIRIDEMVAIVIIVQVFLVLLVVFMMLRLLVLVRLVLLSALLVS